MNRTTLATIYRILTKGRNLLAHLLCLLLILSTPALAQGTCNNTYSVPIDAMSGECATTTNGFIWDSRTLSQRNISTQFEPDTGVCELPPTMRNSGKFLNAYLFGSKPRTDNGPVQTTGVDPATLRPEALDLEIFPSIPISDQLQLKPSLSYSEDVCMQRLGRVHFGAPKEWRNHHGELIIMLPGTFQSKVPVNQLKEEGITPSGLNDYVPEIREVQLFFVNANGQQVNFYPDPSQFGTGANVDNPSVDHFRYWYSSEGNYRLEDKNHDSTTQDHFNFELKTPEGLSYQFERYQVEKDTKRESMAVRFRVNKISDRYGNYLGITFEDVGSQKSLQPDEVKAYTKTDALLHTLDYEYLADGRLSSIDLPGYGTGSPRNVYRFYYPDAGTVHPGMPARHNLNNAGNGDTSLVEANGVWRAQLNPLVSGLAGFASEYTGEQNIPNLYFDFEQLGFAPEPMVDFTKIPEEDYQTAGYGIRYRYPAASPTYEGFLFANYRNRQEVRFQSRFEGTPGLTYRYQVNGYPTSFPGFETSFKDILRVNETSMVGDGFPNQQKVAFDVYPMLKDGDTLVWQVGTELKSLEVNLIDGDSIDAEDFSVKLRGTETPGNVTNAKLIREDARTRITEIEFPTSTGSSHKRMLFKYDDKSLNHQEIEQVQIYDVNSTDALLLAETIYTYEQALIQSLSQDMEEMLPVESITPDLWRNCDPDRDLSGASVGVNVLGRHELTDMMRKKTTRYLKHWRDIGDTVSDTDTDYQYLTTHYGGAFRFDLMTRGVFPENTSLTDLFTCDRFEWGLAAKPFYFTWQINPDGTGIVYDLSSEGLGLEPALAHANQYRRVFKTYRFDNKFKELFIKEGTENPPFMSFTKYGNEDRFTPYYHYLPSNQPESPCTNCSSPVTVEDLAANPVLPTQVAPKLGELFSEDTKCFAADWSTYELIPLYRYSIDTDATHGTSFQRRWTIKALNGTLETVPINPTQRYLRLSPVTAIDLDSALNGSEDDAVELFFRGDLETCVTWGVPATNLHTIKWNYGGRLDLGSVFHYYHDRQKTHKLLPHSQVQARNLEGFTWNPAGFINLNLDGNSNSPYVVQASRASNGGYLASHSVDSGAIAGAGTLTLNQMPSLVNAGDVFFHHYFLYTVTSVNTTAMEVSFTPALKNPIPPNEVLPFHRFFRGDFPDGVAEPAINYLGYDAFGNSAFQAIYKKDTLYFHNAGTNPEHALVPNFFHASAEPFNLALNDSADPANNDTSTWSFFGRVTKTYASSALPFTDYTSGTNPALKQGWRQGHWATFFFPGSPYAWTPTQQAAWYRPKDLGTINLEDLSLSYFAGLSNPQSHDEDQRTEINYFAPAASQYAFESANSLHHGRPSLTWTGRAQDSNSFNHVDVQRFEYDSRGRTNKTIQAAFKWDGSSWASPYGLATSFSFGTTTMDLPLETKTLSIKPTWDPSGTTAAGRLGISSEILESTAHATYDELGRILSAHTTDAADVTIGEVLNTSYPTQTKQVSQAYKPSGTSPFTTVTSYLDGRGEAVASLRQRGGEPDDAFSQFNVYDSFGRLFKIGFEKSCEVTSSLEDLARGSQSFNEARTENLFNNRSEVYGQVIYRSSSAAESSMWTLLTQEENTGNLITQQMHQAHSEALATSGLATIDAVAVKTMIQNDHGMVAQVRDDRVPLASPTSIVWTSFADETDLETYQPDLTQMPLTKAAYTYDRWENVRTAQTGVDSANLQDRSFTFDQRNRLRREVHPEMTDGTNATDVTYDLFTLFDNPTVVKQGTGRTWTQTYNAAGDMETLSTTGITTSFQYRYQFPTTSTSAVRFPNLPALIRHDEGPQVAYLHEYDDNRGWLTQRTMFHQFPNFAGTGYIANLDSASNSSLASNTDGLELTYSYDVLGRTIEMEYPATVEGASAKTKLALSYNPQSELLTTIVDEAFANPLLTLVEDLRYNHLDQIVKGSLFRPGGSGTTHDVFHGIDSLNRVASWSVEWNETPSLITAQLREGRNYLYDHSGHVAEITSNNDPLYRYTYDSLGQIKQANLKLDSLDETHFFTYDTEGTGRTGFGNLLSIKRGAGVNDPVTLLPVDVDTNQLSNFTYNQYGEQTSDQRNGVTYALGYNALGRLSTYDSTASGDSTYSQYHYDQAGMRVHTADIDVAGLQQERLYFYDQAGMILAEWLAEHDGSSWSHRWDQTYVYLEGKTAFTYEYNRAEPGPVTTGPELPQPQQLTEGLLTWTASQAPYDLEIADENMVLLKEYHGLTLPQFKFGSRLRYGKYHVRMKGFGDTWGAWQVVYYMDGAAQELAGEYGFDNSERDQSFYRNHLGDLSGIGYTFGQYFDALDMQAGESFDIVNPHQFHTSGALSTLSLWIKIPLGNTFAPKIRRKLWDFWHIALWVDNFGEVEIKPKGKPYQAGSVAVPQDTWAHLAVVYGNTTTKVYVNGQLSLDSTDIATNFGFGDMTFGTNNTSNGFEGLLERIRIYNRELTLSEIQTEATP